MVKITGNVSIQITDVTILMKARSGRWILDEVQFKRSLLYMIYSKWGQSVVKK